MQLFDPSTAKYYYHNSETGKYQWDKPAGFTDGHKDNMVMNVMKIQCMWRCVFRDSSESETVHSLLLESRRQITPSQEEG